jgi:hypothetical protein
MLCAFFYNSDSKEYLLYTCLTDNNSNRPRLMRENATHATQEEHFAMEHSAIITYNT